MVWSATRRALENKEEGSKVEEEAEKAESGERMDEVEKLKRGERESEQANERERERERERGFAAGIIGVSPLPTGHNGPSWRVAKRPLLGW